MVEGESHGIFIYILAVFKLRPNLLQEITGTRQPQEVYGQDLSLQCYKRLKALHFIVSEFKPII